MKKIKAAAALIAAVTVISLGSAAVSAADYHSPADIVAELTGKTAEDVTQEEADEILASIKEWQANCDGTGTGSAYAGTGYGRGWGRGMGYGGGCGMGRGMGRGGCW